MRRSCSGNNVGVRADGDISVAFVMYRVERGIRHSGVPGSAPYDRSTVGSVGSCRTLRSRSSRVSLDALDALRTLDALRSLVSDLAFRSYRVSPVVGNGSDFSGHFHEYLSYQELGVVLFDLNYVFAFVQVHVVRHSGSERLSRKSEGSVEIFHVVHQRADVELSSGNDDVVRVLLVREPLRHYATEYEVEVIDGVGKVHGRSGRMVYRIGTVHSVSVRGGSASPVVENAFLLSSHSRLDEKESGF